MANPVVEQEKKKGHDVYPLTEKVFIEVGEYRGKVNIGFREWFRADDGTWYRTKRGFNLSFEEFEDMIATIEDITEFVITRLPDSFKNRNKKKGEEEIKEEEEMDVQY